MTDKVPARCKTGVNGEGAETEGGAGCWCVEYVVALYGFASSWPRHPVWLRVGRRHVLELYGSPFTGICGHYLAPSPCRSASLGLHRRAVCSAARVESLDKRRGRA